MNLPLRHGRRLVAAAAAALGLLACTGGPTPPPEPRASAPSVPELVAKADELYARRGEPDRVREAVALLRRARTYDERSYDALWRLAKFSHHLGETLTDAGARDAAYSEGVAAGHAAVQLESERPEGHYWLGANLAGRTELQGVIGGLAAVGDVRREMEAVIRADEGFERGGAYMLLGFVELAAPRVLGGDKRRAVELLERGLQLGPDNAHLRLLLARAYLDVKRREDARQQLRAIIDMTPNPDYVPEHARAAARARQMLAEEFERTGA